MRENGLVQVVALRGTLDLLAGRRGTQDSPAGIRPSIRSSPRGPGADGSGFCRGKPPSLA